MDARSHVSRVWEGTKRFLARSFGIDTRALAAFRISIGLLLIADLALRSRHLAAFYTDRGVLPTSTLTARYPVLNRISLHALSGDVWFQVLVFVVTGVFAALVVVGYRTTLVTAVSWVLLLSLQLRNPLVLNGGDGLFVRLFFWGTLLPLGERWSIDAARRGEAYTPRERVASVASAGLLTQVVVVYAVNAVLKLRGDLWLSGDAVRYVFSLDQFTVLLGEFVARYPTLLTALDKVWLGLVASSVLLVLLRGQLRALLASAFMAAHLGMLLTMSLGLFPLISVAALLPFLPGFVWDNTEGKVRGFLGRSGTHEYVERLNERLPRRRSLVDLSTTRTWWYRVTTVVAVVALSSVLIWNGSTLGYVNPPDEIDPLLRKAGYSWNMFAPNPLSVDGWYVVPAGLENGSRIDAFHLTPVERDRPPDLAETYPSNRWRKYLSNVWRSERSSPVRMRFAQYLCRRWNGDHVNDLTNVTVYYYKQPTRLGGDEPIRRERIVEYDCFEGAYGN